MGTDIHAFLEIDWGSDDYEPFIDEGDIRPFNTGDILLRRNYELFDALANGRSGNPGLRPRKRPLYPARGIPDVVSWAVADCYYLRVIEPDQDPREFLAEWCKGESLPAPVSRADADRFVADGLSCFAPNPYVSDVSSRGENGVTQIRQVRRQLVSNPNWHHASWLTLAEVHAALDHFGLRVADLEVDVQALLQTMALIEQKCGDGRTRLVFWFDN